MATAPSIVVKGGGNAIADGTTTTSATNDTSFASTALGSSTSETYTITNNGTAALALGTVSFTGTNASDFKVTTQPTASVAAGSSTTFTVEFTPTAAGTRTATVNFTENDSTTTSPFTFAVSGVATGPTIAVTGGGNAITDGATTASASNDTAFGNTAVGSSISETYTISNSGSGPLALGNISLTGTNAADFKVTAQPAASVAAGGSTTFTVQFTPTAMGTRNATVSFTENDSTTTSPFTFAISGVGTVQPSIAVTGGGNAITDGSATPSATNDTAFGTMLLGGTAISETYTITNSGTAALSLGSVSITGTNPSDFTVTSQPTASVAAGSSTTFTVEFNPTAGGTRTATVNFTENDPTATSPFTFAISGFATTSARIAVTGAGNPITDGSTTPSGTNDTAFSSTVVGSSTSETYTITNNGTAALTLGTVSITGTNAADFKVTTQPAASVAVGSSTTLVIQFTPTAGGTRSATVSFEEDDSTTANPFTFAINGVATAPSIAVTGGGNAITDQSATPSATNDTAFGSMLLGGSPLSETYTITNNGTAALSLGSVSIVGTNAADFKVTTQPASSVAAGGSTTFTVQFAPTAAGTATAAVSFTENDTATESPFTFAISGVATAPSIAVTGAGQSITDGSTTPSTTNVTSFGTTIVGNKTSETYTITNNGTAALTLGNVSISGTNAAEFTVTTQPAASVAAGGSTTFTVQFAPTAAGSPTATVSFSENDTTTTSPFTFAIGGTASVASASLSGTAYDDITKNGVLSSSDPVLSGVTIALTGTDASGNTVNLTTTTASDGTYSFGSLAAGTSYTLTATLPSYLAAGTATAGSITPASSSNGTAAGEVISGINLAAGAVGTGYNFGAYGVASQVFSGSSSSTGGNDATIESIMLFSASGPSVSQVLNPLTITGLSNQTVAPGTATSAIPFTVSDVLDPTAKLTVTGTSSNTTVVPTANVVYGGSGADRTITVTPAASQTGTTTITTTVSDSDGNQTAASFTLNVAAAPVVTPSGTTSTFTTGGTAVAVDSSVKVSSSDTDLTSATVTISSGTLQSGDLLIFNNQNGITGSYSGGVLTLSGSATVANYQAALESVTFSTTSTNTTARDISIVALDNSLASTAAAESVDVAAASTSSPSIATNTPAQAAVDQALSSEDDWTT